VCLTVAGSRHCSSNESNTTFASWSYPFPTSLTTANLLAGVRIEMLDSDGLLNPDDRIGDVTAVPTPSAFASGLWSLAVGRSQVTLAIQPAP
jgi:hypothetical protein